ncbi:MAG: site-specific DNA-methyltransferase [Paludibacteraceae bacterium]|nr:site-specific DNA-methyltransferase [Paludibacteraceae bacterium]
MPTLNWIGKESVINHHHDVPFRTLEQKYTFGEGTDDNKIIHGDNLEALKALLPEYEGRIKCIYIDPPYNTGNENWVYNDNVNSPKIRKWLGQVVGKEAEDLTRHDKWLCMMYPRLKLLQKLLSDDGAIFISIDDNEQANLKLICDEIFGAGNFITSIPWQSRASLQNDTDLSINHEYIVCFAKSRRKVDRRLKESNAERWFEINEFAFYPIRIDNGKFSNPDNDPRGPWKADPMDAPHIRPNLTYPITNPNTGEQHLPPSGRHWRILPEKFASALADGRIIFGKNGKGRPQMKVFLSEKQDYGSVPNSWFTAEKYGTATMGTKELEKVFSEKYVFETPKPTTLLENLLSITATADSIILDSFAGSGTTAHAVLNLNKQDGGNRKFILVEMEDYAENITAERVRRVINGYGEDKNAVEGTGGSFSFYELGEPVFNEDGYMNEKIGREKLCEYIWYTETRTPYATAIQPNKYLLGIHQDTSYYFYYEPEKITTLSHDTLNIISEKAETYVVYADQCVIDKEWLSAHNIIFKKIPRDISRF